MRRIALSIVIASATVLAGYAQSAPLSITTLAPIPGRLLESDETPGAGPTLLQREVTPAGLLATVRRLGASGAIQWARGFNPDPGRLTDIREHQLEVGEDGSVILAVRFTGSAKVYVTSFGPGGEQRWTRSYAGVTTVDDLALGAGGEALIGLSYASVPGSTVPGSIVDAVAPDGTRRWRKASVAVAGVQLAAAGPVWMVAETGVPSRLTGLDQEGRTRWQSLSLAFVQRAGRLGNGFYTVESPIGAQDFVRFFGPDGRETRSLLLCGCEDVNVSRFGTAEFSDSQVTLYRPDGFFGFRRNQLIFGAIPTTGEAIVDPAETVWTMATGTAGPDRLTQLIRFDRNGQRLLEATPTSLTEFTLAPRLHLGAASDAFLVGAVGDRTQVARIRAVLRPRIVTVSAATVRSGVPFRLRVISDQPAGQGGAKITLASDSPVVRVPGRVEFTAGQAESTVTLTAGRVTQPTPVRLTVGSGATARSVNVQVLP